MVKTYGIIGSTFPEASKEEIYEYFKEKEFIQVDTETTGFDGFNDDILCLQLGDYDNQFVIGRSKVKEFKELLENLDKTCMFHNAKFDLKFLYKYNIWPQKIYDTFLAESVITCGIKNHKRNLGAVAKARANVDLDKSVRDTIWQEGLTETVIQYAADDVKYLEIIRDSQLKEAKELNLEKVIDLENEFVIVLAYIERCGMKIDVSAWREKQKRDVERLYEAKAKLDKYIIDNNLTDFISNKLELFNEDPIVSINWNSSKQVGKLFTELGVPIEVMIKGEKKNSVMSKYIEKHIHKYPIVKEYLEYKKAQKLVTTYGDNFLHQINKYTGRIHTNFRQIMNTGRLSSGGKNRETKEEYINFQNIPKDKDTRSCFVANKGNDLIICDYTGQEQVILANKSLDKNLLDFYDKGMSDMHSFIASKMYPELEGLSVDEIKEKHGDKRYNAKTAGFAINYGGVGMTIAANNNVSIEEGNKIYDSYFKAFPGLRSYFDKSKQEGLVKGFIEFNNVTNRKCFVDEYQEYKELNKEINSEFWERWKVEKARPTELYPIMKEKIKTFFKIKGKIERDSLNYPTQGTAADMVKIAGINIFKWIKEHNLIDKVLIPNVVHDEYVIESPTELTEEVKMAVETIMNEAGDIFCKRVPCRASVNISQKWNK